MGPKIASLYADAGTSPWPKLPMFLHRLRSAKGQLDGFIDAKKGMYQIPARKPKAGVGLQ